MFLINFRIALRNLWKNKGFSLINIGGLAIGMTCCLMLLMYVGYEWSYDKQFKDIDRIYAAKLTLNVNGKLLTTDATPNKLAGAALVSLPSVETASRIAMGESTKLFGTANNNFKLTTLNVDPGFLKIFDYKFIQGNPETALSEPNSVLLTASAAKRLFGSVNVLGSSVKWDNSKILKVSAVVEDLPKNMTHQFEALQPWSFFEQEHPGEKDNGWGSITCFTLFKLKDKASFEVTDAGVRQLIKKNDKETTLQAFLFPFGKYHLYDHFENGKSAGGRIDQVRLFIFLAFCVLLIACINYMNLSTARSEKRAREVGVRKALGASRKTLIGQFVMESLVLSLIGILIAFVLLEGVLPYFNNLLDISIQINYKSPYTWVTLLSLILFTGVLAGSYPAFYLSSFTPVKVLKGFTGIGKSSLPMRKILVVVQFTISICMIVCAIVIYSQIQFMKNKPLGFNENNLVQLDLEGEWLKLQKLEIFKAELKNAGAIVSATEFASSFTQGGTITGDISWPGKAANDNSIIDYRSTGFDFVKTIGTTMVMGRDFSPKFVADTATSLLLNESAVRTMGLKNPVGSKITWGDQSLNVIGVVKDYTNEQLGAKSKPTVFYCNIAQSKVLLLRLNPDQSLSKSVQSIKDISLRLNPSYPADLQFVNQGMQQKLKTERLLSVLSNLFGCFAIFISCLGLLGLALYIAEQRSKEISIRKVLGADLKSILVLLNKDFIKLVILSNMIAIPAAYIIAVRWLQKYDYKVAMTAWPFLIALFLSVFIAILTVSFQTVKVAKANAVDALKYE
ncbi:ABC transporter permease [Pedobacter panaciterrae]|uniref:ABC transporter permease n=1 Tax=Pedobacter panaciterrae TaxID=363849 RepID=A0ABU8NTI2_9SPHI|nr:ABC transporter permease [Pedobacter panaciterrae]NQX54846.1 ABC transporter permease [Pedobacter panaciterrae]